MNHLPTSSHSYKHKRRMINIQIEPTLGGPFTMSCSPYLTIERFKEDISDRLGISPKKMSLLHKSIELKSGMLSENGLQEGSEIKLVPCVESGVNTPLTMDPVAMMKHSMSNISDQQIDDFLSGKSPLSVAIRLGESVVVVNLNRAKVEEVELDNAPPEKKHSSLSASRESSSSAPASPGTATTSAANNELNTASLNTNPHWSSTTHTPTVTPTVTPPCIRSAIPAGIPTPDSGSSSPAHLGKNMSTPTPTDLLIHETSALPTKRRRSHDSMDTPTTIVQAPSSGLPTSLSSTPLLHSHQSCLSSSSRPIKKAVRRSNPSKSSSSKSNKLNFSQSEWEELRRLKEIPSSQNGVSMKRKAVMEAIGEILKKMYAQRIKGKVPGTFKGRFSSEFTCDSDMQEIIHSKTTMTSYGDMDPSSCHGHNKGSSENMEVGAISHAKFKENEELKDKMALLKWKLKQQKAMKRMKRERSEASSPCPNDWINEVDCDLNPPPPKLRKKTGFCGLKKGFLLAD